MGLTLDNISRAGNKQQAFDSFINKKPRQFTPAKKTEVKSEQTPPKSKKKLIFGLTATGFTAVGVGAFFFVKGNKGQFLTQLKDSITVNAEIIKNKLIEKNMPASYTKGVDFLEKKGKQSLDLWYNLDKAKDHAVSKLINGLGFVGKNIQKITKDLPIKATEKMAQREYKKLTETAKLFETTANKMLANAGNSLTQQEKQQINSLLNGNNKQKGAIASIKELSDDFVVNRSKKIKTLIDTEIIQPYHNYWEVSLNPKYPMRSAKKILSDFASRNIIDGNIDKVNKKIENNITVIANNFPKKLIEIKNILKKTKNKSPEQQELYKNLVTFEKSIQKTHKDTIDFEINRYAGRVKDLMLGGGTTETMVPLIGAGILTNNIINEENPERKKEKILRGGAAIGGGLLAWSYISVFKCINGAKALLYSAASGISLDQLAQFMLNQKSKTPESTK